MCQLARNPSFFKHSWLSWCSLQPLIISWHRLLIITYSPVEQESCCSGPANWVSSTRLCLRANSLQEQDPYVLPSFYSTGCSAQGVCYTLCIANNWAFSTQGKHLPERARSSGRFLLTSCYCMSVLLSLRGAKCQDKFKCQASREACQSWGEHPPWSKDQPMQDQTSEKRVALSCACSTQGLCKPQGPPGAPSSPWDTTDLRISTNCPVNSYPAAFGCDLPGFQVTRTRIEEW